MEDAGVRTRRASGEEGAIMRSTVTICAGVLLFAATSPAAAQYGMPYTNPGMWAPEFANGALGAGAANNSGQPYCGNNTSVGRDGPRTQCQEAPPPGESKPRR
jgi:hypothetical protein